MIINQSQVAMSSSRAYLRRQSDSYSMTTKEVKPNKGSFLDMLGQISGNEEDDITTNSDTGKIKNVENTDEGLSNEDDIFMTFQTINYLLRLLFYKQMGGSNNSVKDMIEQYQFNAPKMYSLTMNHTSSYYESETMCIRDRGKVVTADGREIDFGIEVSMSRTFAAEYSESLETNLKYIDPLVINLDANPTKVSDMKFEFDLDADGKTEEISMLGTSSAFLAIDLDGNGEIDDGSELFGAKSGDGFKDLAEYDADGNGWIDEADDVFNKLRLWQVHEDGTKTLVPLKDKNIGALYLGNVNSKFSLTNENNETNAVIRKSGVYLTEDGNVGQMAHVDLVS